MEEVELRVERQDERTQRIGQERCWRQIEDESVRSVSMKSDDQERKVSKSPHGHCFESCLRVLTLGCVEACPNL